MTQAAPLKRIASINDDALRDDTPLDREIDYIDIGSVGTGQLLEKPSTMAFGDAPSRARRILRDGDTIVSTVRTYLRAVLHIGENLDGKVASTGFAVIRPRDVDPGYLGWVLQGGPFIDDVVSRSVGVSYPAINPSQLGAIRIPTPEPDEQRRIADFLDRETARIDALIEAKESLARLIEERAEARIDTVLGVFPWVPLRRIAARVSVGIAEAATHAYATSGVPLLRSTNIRAGWIDETDILFIEPWFADRNRSKYVLAGDILTVRTGSAGVSAVVPDRLHGSQVFTQLITTVVAGHSAEIVAFALNSSRGKGYFRTMGWGTAQTNISVPLLGSCPVPLVPEDEAGSVRRTLATCWSGAVSSIAALASQARLLTAYRQAVVTAAVTGQLDEATLNGSRLRDDDVPMEVPG